MSLLIKGMNMPKSCEECPCREYPEFSFESDWCCLNKKTISDVKVISPNCPFIKIPASHGRLIDADAYIDKHEECGWLDDITVDEFNAITPTIIEAEGVNE